MPREARPWFRFYCEAVWDRKLRRLDPDHRWLWVVILATARQSSVPGHLLITADQPQVVDDLADAANLPVDRVDAGLAAFVDLGMLTVDGDTWVVSRWAERQFESDFSTERSRKARSNDVASTQRPAGNGDGPPSDTDPDPEGSFISGQDSGPSPQAERSALREAVVDAVARHDLRVKQEGGKGDPVHNPDAWLVTARRRAATKHGAKIDEALLMFDTDDPQLIADVVTGKRDKRNLGHLRRPKAS